MKKVIMTLTIIIICIANTVVADPGDTVWTKTYGGIYGENAYSIQPTSDGGYIMAGLTSSYGAGSDDFYLIKIDEYGDTLWTKTHGGINSDYATDIKQTNDSGYIVVGRTYSFGDYSRNIYLIRTDQYGDTLWTRIFGGSSLESASDVLITNNGGYLIVGNTQSYGAGDRDFYIIMVDSLGNTQWTKTYGYSGSDWPFSADHTNDGGYIIVGQTCSPGYVDCKLYLMKIDAQGDSLWTLTYSGISEATGYSVRCTDDGGYIVAGHTWNDNADFYLVKTDANGDSIWTRTYGGTSFEECNSMLQTHDGGFILAGVTESFGLGGKDCYVVRTDSIGDTIWTRTYGGTELDRFRSVVQTNDYCYLFTGQTLSFGASESDFYLVKVKEISTWHISTTGNDTTGDGSQGNPFATIQHGIDIASDGDTVLVSDGQYYERINFYSKGIIVASEYLNDSDTMHIVNTIIDGDTTEIPVMSDTGSVVCFVSGEDSTSILQGFTIRGGTGTPSDTGGSSGGGILCGANSSRPEIKNCTITNNSALYGGGIFCMHSSLLLIDCDIINNTATNGGGFGAQWGGSVRLENSLVANNSSGGWSYEACAIILENSTFEDGQHITCQSMLQGGGSVLLNNSTMHHSNIIYFSGPITETNFNSPIITATNSDFFGSYIGGSIVDVNLTDDSLYYSSVYVWDLHTTRIMRCNFSNSNISVGNDGFAEIDSSLISGSISFSTYQNYAQISITNSTIITETITVNPYGRGLLSLENAIVVTSGQPTIAGYYGNINISCCDFYGFDSIWFDGTVNTLDTSDVYFLNPEFCGSLNENPYTIASTSICTPENNNCGQLIGAFGVGCSGLYNFHLLNPSPDLVYPDTPDEFTWESTIDADSIVGASYILYIDDDLTFDSSYTSDTLTDTSYVLADTLARSTQYYWRVLAFNDYAPPRLSTETWNFYIDGYPTIPVIINPVNGEFADTLTYLTWLVSTDPDSFDVVSYTVQIDEDSLFASPEINQSGLSSGLLLEDAFAIQLGQLDDIGNLLADTKYYWRVRADDNYGLSSAWPDSLHYFIYLYQNHPPEPPLSGFSPANYEEVISLTPTITWHNATDPDPDDHAGTLHYIFWLFSDTSTGCGFEYWDTTDAGVNQVIIADTMPDNCLWIYFVKTVDDEDLESSWSAMQHFWTNHYNYPPEPFPVFTPSPNTRRVDYYTYFNWGNTVDYDPLASFDFTLQLSPDSSFNWFVSSFLNNTDTSLVFITDTLALAGDDLYWRILAIDDDSLITVGGIPDPEVRKLTIVPVGDCNGDGLVYGGDLTYLVNFFRMNNPPSDPLLSADVNGNCEVEGGDLTYLVNFFRNGDPPIRGDCEGLVILTTGEE